MRERGELEGMLGIVGPRKRCLCGSGWSGKFGREETDGTLDGRPNGVPDLEVPFSLAERPLVRTKAVERRWCGLRS